MNQGTQGYSLTKKIEGRKSRETVPLITKLIIRPVQNHVKNYAFTC
jgi:hypothetical protein